jgi:alginate O-acetyltransferase complex protein AlgI
MLVYAFCVLLVISATIIRRGRLRQLLLLAASYLFYVSFGMTFLAVLILSSVFNFGYGLFLQRNPSLMRLWGGIGANVLLLAFFKTAHLLGSVTGPTSTSGRFLNGVAMPLGISFWTFQALSYLFDVYRQEDLNPSLLEFCLYLAFWPTVIMGPICRMGNMLPQFREGKPFSESNLLVGTKRIAMGLFMKIVVSQVLATGFLDGVGVTAGFDHGPERLGGLDVWFLAVGFGLQLFFDFAGYSHIVIGAARICGFYLDENFDAPFVASTPSEFWNRWHMSLSSWIRDYVFVPISAAKREIWWRYCALVFSMSLFGLWHGAQSTLVLWGTYQGMLLVVHRLIQQARRRTAWDPPRIVDGPGSWVLSFLSVSLGWVLFRANSLGQALRMFRAVLTPRSYWSLTLSSSYYVLVIGLLFGYLAYQGIYLPAVRGMLTQGPADQGEREYSSV